MRSLKLLLQHDKLEFEKQRFPNWSLGTSTTKMFGTLGIRVGRGSGELAERFENNSMLGRMSLVTIRIPKEPIFYLTQRRNVKELNHEICETHKSKVEVLCIFLDFCSRHLESSFSLPSLDAGYRHPCRYDGLFFMASAQNENCWHPCQNDGFSGLAGLVYNDERCILGTSKLPNNTQSLISQFQRLV